ncbi:Dabb family protein [Brucella intermedia]|uniref:Dabb family protein n=1 Tax=Brucella intermedia TaxID=94625 RepID=A0A7V6PGU5_9HYPH|nr:Dabb family protein [Brucella intermedia]PJR90943.1 stress responsive alpha-beta barrel [Ochrobactrum sp. 721/2009]PJT17123.1 stress responsive alpha-beta barrel [Ochrobactrum sp. 720/2009]PJT25592.1 stress responsive alpha-beta barrel [Ochrobactrum sp. 715/2009]PJT29198.1 stress responsive alpha-beta barrel [Ochrobactrum sp. 695/2009]PJT35114.1 stress responsive alpha-beta barrel [Ochrobactrum sp. 689/2009]
MRRLSVAALLSVLLLSVSSAAHAGSVRNSLDVEQERIGTKGFTAGRYKPGTIQHIVLFRFKDGVTAAQIGEVKQRFLALKDQARRNGKPYIVRIDAGAQSSGEGVSRGFQQGFIVTFRSEGDRNYYVGSPVVTNARFYDPAHQRFKDFVGPLLAEKDGVLVFDFRAE